MVVTEPVQTAPGGEQWSVGLEAEYESFGFGVTYITLDTGSDADADNLLVGAAYGVGPWSVGAYWGKILTANGSDAFEVLDGADAYGLTGQYDLGGGATVNAGVVRTYPQPGSGSDPLDPDSAVIGDFGVRMVF